MSKRVDGQSLVQKFPGVEREVRAWYWVGLLPERAPGVSVVHVAGIAFPVAIQEKAPAPGEPRRTRRGAITSISGAQMETLAERLPWRVLRPVRNGLEVAGDNVRDVGSDRARVVSRLVVVPTPEELEAANRLGRIARPYRPGPEDRPVAECIWLQLCADQRNPRRGPDDEPPPPLSETGLVFPPGYEVEPPDEEESLFAAE